MFTMVACTRSDFLRFFPKKLVTLEIGVQAGHFSDEILRTMRPAAHHMIDPYLRHDDAVYDLDIANTQNHELLYQHVLFRFAAQLEDGSAVFHRGTSQAVARDFPDGYFDFIYIDAMHYYDAVLLDLFTYSKKLKRGGILAGHDFTRNSQTREERFGVIEAVKEFTRATEFSLHFITWEPWSSYFLARKDSDLMRGAAFRIRRSGTRYIHFDDQYCDKIVQEMDAAPLVCL